MPILLRRDLPEPIALRDGMRVLEIGCGTGETIADVAGWFQEMGLRAELVGIDSDPTRRDQFVRTMEEHGVSAPVRFVAADAFTLPDLGQFDLLLCINALAQIVFGSSAPRFRGLDPSAVIAAWRAAPEKLTATVCAELLAQWAARMVPQGTLVILDLYRDTDDEAHARGVELYEGTKWPMLPVPILTAALEHGGFDTILVRSIPQAQYACREEVDPWLGGGSINPEPFVPVPHPGLFVPLSLWAGPSLPEGGTYAYSTYVLQARRAGGTAVAEPPGVE